MPRDLRDAVGGATGSRAVLICNPSRQDDTPSLAIYDNGAYDFGTGIAYDIPEALALLGKDGMTLPERVSNRTTVPERRKRTSVSWGLIATWSQCLLVGPRRHRIDWLLQRGLSRVTVNRYGLGHTGIAFSIPIPLGNRPGTPERSSGSRTSWAGPRRWSYKLRRDDLYADPDLPRYRNLKGMSTVLYRPNPASQVTVVCEGELDALLLCQLGLDAITSTGGAGDLARRLGHVALPRRVYILTDQDEAGESAAVALQSARTSVDWVRVHWQGGNDVTDVLAPLSDAERVSQLRRWLR